MLASSRLLLFATFLLTFLFPSAHAEDLPPGCRQNDAIYTYQAIYSDSLHKTGLLRFEHTYNVALLSQDKSKPHHLPICVMPAGFYGSTFQGDTITWSNSTPFKISFKRYSNADRGCSLDSPFRSMPSASAVSTAEGKDPTTGTSQHFCNYKVILTDSTGKPLDPHLRVCHLSSNFTVRC